MPRFDKTGPEGTGPKTGRGLGICGTSGSAIGEEHRNFFVRGRGPGYGRGRGFRFWIRRNQDDSGSSNSEK